MSKKTRATLLLLIGIIILLPILAFLAQVLFVPLLIVGVVVLKVKYPEIKGAVGEWRVNKELENLGPEYKVFHDLYIPVGDGATSQVDHIVTSPYGVFVIETKHYKGWIFGGEWQKSWTQVIHKRKEKFFNPIRQNYGHVKALEKYLELDEGYFYSIIAFSESSTFKFQEGFSTADVIQFSQLVHTIHQTRKRALNDLEIHRLNQQLSRQVIKNRKVKKKVQTKHVEVLRQNQKDKAELERARIQEGKCPRCGGELSKKKGRHGSFYGCSGFPNCRYTKRIS